MRPPLSLQARALQLLAQREHSRVELRRKLIAHAERLAGAGEAGSAACGRAARAVGGVEGDPSDDTGASPEAAPTVDSEANRNPTADADADAETDPDPSAGARGVSRTRRAAPSTRTLAQVDALLDALAASGALSESRFVESRVRARAARQGNLRIVQELARHGLALPPGAAQDLKASEYARAKEVWQRKFGAPAEDAAGRARQMRFLAARGFSADVVRRILRGAADED